MAKADIVKAAIRRFHHLPALTISRYILHSYGDQFDNDLETIRTRVRYYLGKHGDKNRKDISDKDLFRDEKAKMPQTWRMIRKPYILPPGLWLALFDVHVPFHEPKPLEAAIRYGQMEKVDGILLGGDIWDCASVSHWPQTRRDFNKETELFLDFLNLLRGEFPGKKIVYKPGNHEYRLPRYFVSKAPELIGSPLAAMETVIGFEEMGIDFLDYFQIVQAGKLPILHGHEVGRIDRSVNPARGLFLRTKSFAACGHCHTTSQHNERNIKGEILTTWSFGCLCDLSPEYSPYGNRWNWGFGLVNVQKDGNFEVVNRRILPSGQVV